MSRSSPLFLAIDPGVSGAAVLARQNPQRPQGPLVLCRAWTWESKADGVRLWTCTPASPTSPHPTTWTKAAYRNLPLALAEVADRGPYRQHQFLAAVEGTYQGDHPGQVRLHESAGAAVAIVSVRGDFYLRGGPVDSPTKVYRPQWRQWVHVWRQGTKPGAAALENYARDHAHKLVTCYGEDWLLGETSKARRGHLGEACGIAGWLSARTRTWAGDQ